MELRTDELTISLAASLVGTFFGTIIGHIIWIFAGHIFMGQVLVFLGSQLVSYLVGGLVTENMGAD